MKRFLRKKIPTYFFVIALGLLALVFYNVDEDRAPANQEEALMAAASLEMNRQMDQIRLNDYRLVKPLLLTNLVSESENLLELKGALKLEIEKLKSKGTIDDASVYVQRLNDNEWISVNKEMSFAPGSMIKIAAVMTYLKMAETNPELLSRQFQFKGSPKGMLTQANDVSMIAGQDYSGKDLVERAIVNSDNDATQLINESLDNRLFKKLFTDLEIPEPDFHDPNFTIDAAGISKFLSVLYNATYLNKENSEYILSLLSQSSFSTGIVGGLPSDIKIAHKFGETGNAKEAQLHETAIVYIGDEPYLITIMTRGKNVHRLPEALSGLSKIAYEKMKIAG